MEDAGLGNCESNQAGNCGYDEHEAEKFSYGADEVASFQFRTASRPRSHSQTQAKRQSNPPSGNNAPEQSQNRG